MWGLINSPDPGQVLITDNININIEKGRWQRIPREQRYVIGCTRDNKISTRCIYTERPTKQI